MCRMFLVSTVLAVSVGTGCGDESDKQAPPSTPAPASSSDHVKSPVPDAEQAPAELQARAEKLKAIPWSELSKLEVGEEAIVLIQGQTKNVGAVYGTGPYTADSFPPAAVVHAGLLKDGEWGLIRFKIIKYDGDHGGSEQNGINASKWGKYHRSYTVEIVADE